MAKPSSNWPGRCCKAFRVVWWLPLFLGLAGVPMISAGDPPSTNFSTSVALAYQEADYIIYNQSLSPTLRTPAFAKEPAVTGKVYRGMLELGASNDLPFIWQRSAGRLFLDLNRNQDLTDDAAGVFSARADSYQIFTNLELVLATPLGRCQVRADLHLWDYGYNSRLGCSLALHSFWQGRATLAGKDWQVGWIPNATAAFGSHDPLLFRAWADRDQHFGVNANTFDTLPFPDKLFVGGHAYALRLQGSGEFQPVLQFAEQNVALGSLQIAGKFIRRLQLPGDDWTVLCERPGEVVQVPVGRYFSPSVLLEQGGVQAFYRSDRRLDKAMVVSAQVPGVLAVGGPLTNSLSASPRREDLSMAYRLLGTGGIEYQLVKTERANPPGFVIYKDGQQIAAGKFEFG